VVLQSFAGETATAVATVTAGFVTSVRILSSGSEYVAEPTVTVSGGGGSGASFRALINNGSVDHIIILSAGRLYSSAPVITIEPPPKEASLTLAMVPKLIVTGNEGDLAQIQRFDKLSGTRAIWTNIVIGPTGSTIVDLTPNDPNVFYKLVKRRVPDGPQMVKIPGGKIRMPAWTGGTYLMTVDPFLMDNREVTVNLWTEVRQWGLSAGYKDIVNGMMDYPTVGFPLNSNTPIHNIGWLEAVKWCNARSEREGRRPAYYVGESVVFRNGQNISPSLKLDSNGYRLPMEAEWELAARGGVEGKDYPWGSDTITSEDANYNSNVIVPNTNRPDRSAILVPVGSYAPNSYGLYDMAGNIAEFCFNLYGNSSADRVVRGGNFSSPAEGCKVSYRYGINWNATSVGGVGFRCVIAGNGN